MLAPFFSIQDGLSLITYYFPSKTQSTQLGGPHRALLAQLLQAHGVVVKGGADEAHRLLDSLLVSGMQCTGTQLIGSSHIMTSTRFIRLLPPLDSTIIQDWLRHERAWLMQFPLEIECYFAGMEGRKIQGAQSSLKDGSVTLL